MKQITAEFKKRLSDRLNTIIKNNEQLILTHKNGVKEELIVGRSRDSIYIYNNDADLITAFEIEGGNGAYELNLKNASIWLYKAAYLDQLVSDK